MDSLFEVARAVSLLAFFFFGAACLVSCHMREEFERYGLARYRVFIGCLEIAGALGLALGGAWPVLLVPAAAGLSLLMFMGVLTRIRIRDSLLQTLPALGLLLINAFLLVHALSGPAAT